jgi:iron(III) transport system ATP-binding protein
MSFFSVEHASVNYGRTHAVRDVSLQLARGELGCLLGPSGCGKTSLLRAIAGFEPLASGRVILEGDCLSSPELQVPPEQRRIGMVFQDYGLFPHLRVAENVAFGLGHLTRVQRRERVAEMLALVGLAKSGRQMPHQLSGGQQQRVALARALAPEPRLLLLDEPFASLDREMREELSVTVRNLLKARRLTAVMVTHDQQEAFALADQVTLMNHGRAVQTATPHELYHQPRGSFAATFIGSGRVLEFEVTADAELPFGLGRLNRSQQTAVEHGRIALLIRPDQVQFDRDGPLLLPIRTASFRGAHSICDLELPDGQLLPCLVPGHVPVVPEMNLSVSVDLGRITPVAGEEPKDHQGEG